MKKRALAFSIALSALAGPVALAQGPGPSPPPPAPYGAPRPNEADSRFRRGVELYREADYATALIEFRRAYEIDPRFQVLYNVGETYDQLQDYASALRTFEKYLHDGGAAIATARRDEVQREIEKLRTRVATLEVTTNVPEVEISVDDLPVGKTPLAAPLVVSAGRRKLTATRAGKPPVTQIVELAGGDTRKLALTLADDAVAPPPENVPVAPSPIHVPPAPWIVTGVLAAGAAVTGALALVSSNDLKTKLAVYPDANAADISSAHSKTFALALTTDVLIGAAVVAGGVAVYFTATGGSRDDHAGAPPPRVAWTSPFSTRPPPPGGALRIEAGPSSARLSGAF